MTTLYIRCVLCALISSLLAEPVIANAESSWHPVEEIARAAERRIAADRGLGTSGSSAKADRLDSNLRVRRCDEPLVTRYPGPTDGPRVTVGVSCRGNQQWQVYVSVRTIAWQPIVVLSGHFSRGHRLTAADLRLRRVDISTMSLGYFADPNMVVGRTLTRSLPEGSVVTPAAVSDRTDVHKGQTVTLIASIRGARIKMSGEALADGAIGQRVRVRNQSSGRTVEGTIQPGGDVLISP
ncbi:MAG: flagellar basal body P-ring formation chaperone FlgA [Pseudomonadota bacterium]